MPNPLESACTKLAWGRKHAEHFEREVQAFLKTAPGECFAEPDPENPDYTLQKIRLTRPLPEHLSLIAGDAVDNMRAALDHAIYAVATISASAGRGTRHTSFPFAGSDTQFEHRLNGLTDIPKELWPLLRSFQPYKGGNQLLVSLNRACNRNKHALLVSLIGIPQIVTANMSGKGFIRFPSEHVWDREKNEMLLFTEGPGAQREGDFNIRFLIALTDIIEFEQAHNVLHWFGAEVERVLRAIEAEAQRLGIIC